jgi:hypothetical protein
VRSEATRTPRAGRCDRGRHLPTGSRLPRGRPICHESAGLHIMCTPPSAGGPSWWCRQSAAPSGQAPGSPDPGRPCSRRSPRLGLVVAARSDVGIRNATGPRGVDIMCDSARTARWWPAVSCGSRCSASAPSATHTPRVASSARSLTERHGNDPGDATAALRTCRSSHMSAWRTVGRVGRDPTPARAPAGPRTLTGARPACPLTGSESAAEAGLATARGAACTRRRDDRAVVRFATRASDSASGCVSDREVGGLGQRPMVVFRRALALAAPTRRE